VYFTPFLSSREVYCGNSDVLRYSGMPWATSVPILVLLGLSVLDLGPMYATDRRQTEASLNATPIRGGAL